MGLVCVLKCMLELGHAVPRPLRFEGPGAGLYPIQSYDLTVKPGQSFAA
jgi:hypothetical protein